MHLEVIAAAGDTTLIGEDLSSALCAGGVADAAGRADRPQAPKMPSGIRKTNSNTPFGGEGTGIFP